MSSRTRSAGCGADTPTLRAAGEAFDFKALFAEVVPHQFYDVAFIFNDYNTLSHIHIVTSAMLQQYFLRIEEMLRDNYSCF